MISFDLERGGIERDGRRREPASSCLVSGENDDGPREFSTLSEIAQSRFAVAYNGRDGWKMVSPKQKNAFHEGHKKGNGGRWCLEFLMHFACVPGPRGARFLPTYETPGAAFQRQTMSLEKPFNIELVRRTVHDCVQSSQKGD